MKPWERKRQAEMIQSYVAGNRWKYREKLVRICEEEECMTEIDIISNMKNVGFGLWEAKCPECGEQYILRVEV